MEFTALHFTPCGLAYDVVGVLFLGTAFFLKTKKDIIDEAGTYWNSNPYVLRSIISSKLDGICGTSLLLIGFIYQIFGYLNFNNNNLIISSYVLLAIFILIYIVNFRKRIVNKWCSELEDIINARKP